MNALLGLQFLVLFAVVYYFLQRFVDKGIYQQEDVERDPYWQAIYGNKVKVENKVEEETVTNYVNVPQTVAAKVEEVEISTDSEILDHISQLQSEFGAIEVEAYEVHDVESNVSEKKASEQLEIKVKNDFFVTNDDYLDISELDLPIYQEEPLPMISTEIEGPQQWFVTVLGKEDTFLHVSDGMKKWVDAGEKAKDISINDELMLNVEVIKDRIEVLDIVIIPPDAIH